MKGAKPKMMPKKPPVPKILKNNPAGLSSTVEKLSKTNPFVKAKKR
jgi:hypothetical protein